MSRCGHEREWLTARHNRMAISLVAVDEVQDEVLRESLSEMHLRSGVFGQYLFRAGANEDCNLS